MLGEITLCYFFHNFYVTFFYVGFLCLFLRFFMLRIKVTHIV